MADLTNAQKKEWAKTLYLKENLTQQEIADRVGVSRVSVSNWVRAGKWEEQKVGLTLTRQEQVANLYRQVAEINKAIAERPEGNGSPHPRRLTSSGNCRRPYATWSRKWALPTSSVSSPGSSTGYGRPTSKRQRKLHAWPMRTLKTNYKGIDNETD